MLDDNPFLELTADDPAPSEPEHFSTAEAPSTTSNIDASESTDSVAAASADLPSDWDGDGSLDAAEAQEWGGEASTRSTRHEDDDTLSALDMTAEHESLVAFLHRQALRLRLSEVDRHALRYLIENLNEDGYLEDSLLDLAQGLAGSDDAEQLDELMHCFTMALGLLQSLEPVGVGARDLSECLRLQLLHLQAQQPHDELVCAALKLCQQPLELLARRDVRKLMQYCGLPEAKVRAALGLIGRLEPKPGRRFTDVQRHVVVPDVIVKKSSKVGHDGLAQFHVILNADVMPRLRVHDIYANALRNHKSSDAHAGLQQRLQEARWFIKNVQQRFDTILRVSKAIVDRQKNFFVHGELAMRPLVLRDIADELGLHESTISRVTTAKYMATPHGTYELKFFFGSGLGTETGGNASSTAVRALIKQFVGAENPKKPLSDNQIADMLKEQGIECARRTVAKYREALKISPANLRKSL